MQLAKRTFAIKPSATLAVTAKAQELKAQGKAVIGLGAGEPDFDTPDHIKKAAIDAINNGFTKYTAVDGIPELKNAIIDKFMRDNQLSYTHEQILVSCGGKQSFYNLAQAYLNSDDEVIIPAPFWVSYPDMVLLAEGTPVTISTHIEDNFKITPDKLAKAITPKTKMLVLNSPSNPTGVAYTKAELIEIGKVLKDYPEILIASDDMYEHILWNDETFCNIATACPELKTRTIVLNGVSKAYSMTGWRIGYAAGPTDLIKCMKKIQSQSTSNPCSISQKAAVAALSGSQECIKPMVKAFKERHDYVVKELNNIAGIRCLKADGAFYAFPDISQVITKFPELKNDTDFATFLLEKAGVAVVPGSAFGAPNYIRISFATSMENLKNALAKIKQVITS